MAVKLEFLYLLTLLAFTASLQVVVSRWDNIRDTELRTRAGIARTEVLIMGQCLRWLGHVDRMDNSPLSKCPLVCRLEGGKRSLGEQNRQWCDVIYNDFKDATS